jgi:hypothetical protein
MFEIALAWTTEQERQSLMIGSPLSADVGHDPCVGARGSGPAEPQFRFSSTVVDSPWRGPQEELEEWTYQTSDSMQALFWAIIVCLDCYPSAEQIACKKEKTQRSRCEVSCLHVYFYHGQDFAFVLFMIACWK